MQSYKAKRRLSVIVQTIFLALVAVFFLVPLYITLVNAFKDGSEVVSSPLSLPIPPVIDGIKRILANKSNNVLSMYGSSVILVVCAVPVTIAISAMASYYMARSRTKSAKFLSLYFLAGLMVPYVIVYIPLAILIRILKLQFGLPLLVFIFISGGVSFATFMYSVAPLERFSW